jgi:hypothetical protein
VDTVVVAEELAGGWCVQEVAAEIAGEITITTKDECPDEVGLAIR